MAFRRLPRRRPLSPFPAVVLVDAPALYWRLGEGVGTNAADSSGNGRFGTHAGSVTVGVTGAIVGDADLAASYLGGHTDSTYDPWAASAQVTVAGVTWRNTSTTRDTLFGSTNALLCSIEAGSTNVSFWPDTAGVVTTWANAWPGNGQWVHWALVFDDTANTSELFINGVSKGVQATAATTAAGSDFFKVGTRSNSNVDPLDGLNDEILVYTYALTGTRIAAHFAATGITTAGASLSGSSDGTGSCTGALTAQPQLSGTAAGTGSSTGALTAAPQLSGTAAGTGAATGALTASSRLSGSSDGTGAATGALTASSRLSGTSSGLGDATGTISTTPRLSGISAGVGSASGALTAASLLSGSATGAGAATGQLTATSLLSGSSAGIGASTGALTASSRLSGTSAGTGSASGALTATSLLAGSSDGTGSTTGSVTASGAAGLSGTSAGTGTSTGSVGGQPQLSGASTGTGSANAALTAPALIYGPYVGYRAATLADGPAGYWRQGEPTGTNAVDEVGAHDATYSGGFTLGRPGALAGDQNTAVLYDGISGKATVASSIITAYPASLESWVNLSSVSKRGAVLKLGYAGASGLSDGDGIAIGVGNTSFDNNGNKLIALYENVRFIIGPAIGTGWHHIALTVDAAGVAQLYLDGLPVTTPTGAAPRNPTAPGVQIGGYSGWNGAVAAPRFFGDTVDEPAIYGYVLTAAQVLARFNKGMSDPARVPAVATGTGSVTGQLTASSLLSGTSTGTGTVTGTVLAAPQLSGASAGTGSSTGALTASSRLSGTAAGSGAATGALSATSWLSGSTTGSGSATGSISTVPRLSGTAAGVGSVTGSLSVPGSAFLTGASTGTGSATGALTASTRMSGSSDGVGSVTGSLTASSRLTGSSTGVGSATGALTASSRLTGSAAGTGTSTGALPAVPQLSGSSAGTGATTGSLKTAPQLSGNATGTGSANAILGTKAQLAGSADGQGSSTGAIITQAQLSGSATGVGSVTGVLLVGQTLFDPVTGEMEIAHGWTGHIGHGWAGRVAGGRVGSVH